MRNLVPHFILENYRSGKTRGSIPAVGMFVDISGFSQITDELMDHGQHGGEVLANVMRNIFSPLVQCTYEQGGFISTLAGDAFTAIFPVGEDAENACLRALSAAWQIQQKLESLSKQTTPYGEFTVSGKIGLAMGDASWGVVSSNDERRAVYYIEGTAVEGSALAESKANAGQILVNPQVHAIVADNAKFKLTEDHFLVSGLSFEPPPSEPLNLTIQDSELVYRFYPKSLFHQVHNGEFRQVVTMFVNLPTVRTEDQLDIFMGSLFELQDKYGGLLTRLDFGDKGSNLLIFWGAPLSYENDIERALNLILELQTRTSIPINAGITYRIAHAGFIGSNLREEYSTYGRGVNLAARFMTASQRGDIWVDEEIAKRAEAQFEIVPDGEYTFKGFAQKQKVYLLEERKEVIESIYQTSMVGRQAELDELTDFIEPLSNNEYCGALIILGEPGIGKTRLIHKFSNHVEPEIHWAFCQCDQAIRESLNPFRFWLRQYFSISTFQNESRNKRNFNRRLDRLIASLDYEKLALELDRTRSFLGALIDLYWPDSLFEQVDPQGRYDNTFIGLISLILAESTLQPLILQIEDAQWLDEDSWILLAQLERTIHSDETRSFPFAIIATARIEFLSSGFGDGLSFRELNLGKLNREELTSLSEQLLDSTVSPELSDLLIERTEGNPFFTEQIIQYMLEEGLLRLMDGVWVITDRSRAPLPDDIRALLVSRLDRLTQDVKDVVLTAAVLGREFEVQLLSYMLNGDAALPEKVADAEQNAIWSKVNELRYLFNQALLQDVAYRMQVHAQRQVLHKSAVTAIETLYPQELSLHSTDLAYHCEMAGLVDEARAHMIEAANAAKEAYRNTQAVDYLTRALELTSDEDYQSRYEIIQERVDLFQLLGKHPEQLKDLEVLNFLLETAGNIYKDIEKNKHRSELAIKWADYKVEIGDFEGAIKSAQEIISISEQAGITEDVDDAYFFWSLVLFRQGNYDEATDKGLKGFSDANSIGDHDGEIRLLNLLGLIALGMDNQNEARDYFKRSLGMAKKTGKLRDQARALNNLGNEALSGGNFNSAYEYYQQSLNFVRKIGDLPGEGLVLINLGYIAGIQGDYSTARDHYDQSLRRARQVGNRIQEAYALINSSSVYRALNEFPKALSQASQGLSITREVGERDWEAWSLTSLGNTYIEVGNLEEAAKSYNIAVDLRRSMKQQNLASEPLAGLARIAMKEGDLDEAVAYIDPIIEYLDQGGTLEGTDEPIRVYLTCYQVLREVEDQRSGIILESGYNFLQARGSGINNEVMRNNYYERIPHNRQLLSEWNTFQA